MYLSISIGFITLDESGQWVKKKALALGLIKRVSKKKVLAWCLATIVELWCRLAREEKKSELFPLHPSQISPWC